MPVYTYDSRINREIAVCRHSGKVSGQGVGGEMQHSLTGYQRPADPGPESPRKQWRPVDEY